MRAYYNIFIPKFLVNGKTYVQIMLTIYRLTLIIKL